MDQTSSDVSLEKVTRVLMARMARSALFHIERADVRTGTALELAGLFKRTSEEPESEQLNQIILDLAHPKRLKAPLGPSLFYRSDDPRQQFAMDMKVTLLSSTLKLREAGWSHFTSLAKQQPILISIRTARLLNETRAHLLDLDPKIWQPTALRIYDALESDLLCQLSEIRQSTWGRYEEGLRSSIPKVLRPAISSLEGLEITHSKPSEQLDEIRREIISIADQTESLREACGQYVERLGALPIAGDGSFVELIRAWVGRHADIDSVWGEIWQWATTSVPIAKFYACSYFLSNPKSVPEDDHPKIVEAIRTILNSNAKNPQESYSKDSWFWTIFGNLGPHYLRHLESTAPGANGEPLAILSWWLAARTAEVFSESLSTVAHLQDVALVPEMNNSKLAWHLANPRITHSAASLSTPWSPWQIALLGQINPDSANAISAALDDGQRTELKSEITRCLLLWCPTTIKNKERRIYQFEVDMQGVLELWAPIFLEQKVELLGISEIYAKLAEPDALIGKMDDIANAEAGDQLIIANAARLLSLRGALPLEAVWAKLTNSKWRNDVARKLIPHALEMLTLALAWSLHRAEEKWTASLPHIYADACEQVVDDKERTEIIFGYVVVSCIHSSSVSALERLLQGTRRPDLLEFGREWRQQLQYASREAPSWVAARIRAVIAAISASL